MRVKVLQVRDVKSKNSAWAFSRCHNFHVKKRKLVLDQRKTCDDFNRDDIRVEMGYILGGCRS